VGRGSAAGAGPAQELTLAGGLSISGTALTAAGPLTPTSVASSGAVTSSGGGVGYATGAGGTVIQATSKSTAVTLNKASGQVTTHNASMAAAAAVSFVVNNSQVAATDTINLNLASGNATAGTYRYWVEAIASGSFKIVVENRSGGALAESLTFNFAVLKAVNARVSARSAWAKARSPARRPRKAPPRSRPRTGWSSPRPTPLLSPKRAEPPVFDHTNKG
jgi:hypothetical protein